MGKRKDIDAASNGHKQDVDSSDEDVDLLDVDFEWFDPQEIDFHGLKTLLRQLFDVDHELFDLSALSNLILSQPLLGSTVKVPDDEVATNQTDAFAFLTVLNLDTHRDKVEVKALTAYLASKANNIDSLSQRLPSLFSPTSTAQVGLILTERLMNMPAQIVPPMYKFIVEEIDWAVKEKEPYNFSHYLILSKTYTEIISKLDDEGSRPPKKQKKKIAALAETFYFHPEDEVLQKFAVGFGNYEYTKGVDEGASDSKRAFQEAGVRPMGHMILIESARFEEAVGAVEQYLSPLT